MTAIGYVLTMRTTSTKASPSAPSTASVKKKGSIIEVDGGKILSALLSYSKYVYTHVRKMGGRELKYDEMELD